MTCEKLDSDFPDTILAMIVSLRHFLGWLVGTFRSREDLVLENLALRRQLLALHAQQPRRRLTALHKLFWVALRSFWSGWRKPLVLVTPRSVVNWHRAGFRLYWSWISRVRRLGGRKRVSKEIRTLIFRMVAENPTWGAPRIHGELLKLGFELSERSVSRWIQRAPRDPDSVKRWLTFLRNHREAIAAVGSRSGAVSRRSDLPEPPVSSGSGLTSRTVNRFPDPAASNRACPFRALGFPACFVVKGSVAYRAGATFGNGS